MQPEILVPLDGSTLAETVLPHVVALARATGQPVRLLRSVSSGTGDKRIEQRAAMAQSRLYVGFLADRLRAAGLQVQTTVTQGDPVRRILTYAAEPQTGIVAMATRGYHGMRRWLFASATRQVLQHSPIPVLAVRADLEGVPSLMSVAYRSIIVPLDGTAFAEHALAKAVPLARAMDATLQLLAVMPGQAGDVVDLDGPAADVGVVPLWMQAERDAYMRHMASYLDQRRQELRAAGSPVQVELAYGQPAAEIVNAGKRQPASLVVMATHARSGLQRLWLGSVAQQALEHAPVPMLLVRAADGNGNTWRHVISHEEAFLAGLQAH